MSLSMTILSICAIVITFAFIAFVAITHFHNKKVVEFMELQKEYIQNSEVDMQKTLPQTFEALIGVAKKASKQLMLQQSDED